MSDRTVIGQGELLPRVAVVADDARGPLLAQVIAQIAERGVSGFEVELVLGAHAGEDLGARRHDLVHAWTSGPVGTAWLRAAHAAGVPAITSYDPAAPALGFYDQGRLVLSPSAAADALLAAAGVGAERIVRFRRGVDVRLFHPARYSPEALPGDAFNVLHIGDGGLELAAEAFLVARDRDPHLRLVLAGAAADADAPPRLRLGSRAVALDRLDLERLASVFASSDLLLVTDTDDVFGDSILEAHASGLPVLAVDAGAAPDLIANGRSGCLVPADPTALAAAVRGLARRANLLERLATGGLLSIRERSPEASLAGLADVYALTAALTADLAAPEVARAA